MNNDNEHLGNGIGRGLGYGNNEGDGFGSGNEYGYPDDGDYYASLERSFVGNLYSMVSEEPIGGL